MSRQTVVVVNPASANGRTGKRWPELAARLRARVDAFDVLFTEAPQQATSLTRAALEGGARRVVSVGGDGTHNEVVNGFFRAGEAIAPEATLSIVPTGTGGDLRRTLGLPNDALEAIDLVGQRPVTCDLGRLTYTAGDGSTAERLFVNIASFGVSGLVDKLVNTSSKALGGKASFLIGVGRAAIRYKNQRVRLTLDAGEPFERTLYNGVVANARFFGGGMKVAPDADPTDGLFDVVVMGDLGTLDLARGLPKLYAGDHLGLPKIELHRARRVYAEPVDPEDEVLIDMDGEQPGRLPATFDLLPGALRLCVGPEAPWADGRADGA